MYGVIGDDITVSSVKGTLNYLEHNESISVLYIRGISPGGSVVESYSIADAINEYKKRTGTQVVMVNDCYLASASLNITLESADLILGTKHSNWMLHNAWSVTVGDAEQMRRAADDLDKANEPLIELLINKLGWDADKVKEFLNEERWIDLTEAIEIGLVDGIYDGVLNQELAEKLNTRLQQSGEIDANQAKQLQTMVTNEIDKVK